MSGAITTVVQAKVFTDQTGAATHVPVLLTENGVVDSLLDYVMRMSGRSRAWQRNLLRAVRMLLDYSAANLGSFASERELFASFAERLYTGTVGGCRLSECFHLYVQDVALGPHDPTLPVVRLHHPSEGAAPEDWINEKGERRSGNRAAYLAQRGLRPRTELRDTLHAGWKNPALDGRYYLELRWFPSDYGRLFLKWWQLYLRQIAGVPRAHPFAWLTLERREPATMYRMTHYQRAHARAVRRIGRAAAKHLGTTPHGHRHAYGRRLWAAKLDPLVRMRALHHRALDSQQVYTEPPLGEIMRILAQAETRIATDVRASPVPALLLATGFENVDPGGLLSGPQPKLLDEP